MALRKRVIRTTLFISLVIAIIAVSFFLSQAVASDAYAQSLVQKYGGFGILILSFIAGLNIFLPVPAATFAPIFVAGGMSLFSIIVLLVAGTMAANLLAYTLGRYGHQVTHSHYPELQKKFTTIYHEHAASLPYLVFFFTALVPLPDEVYLIPLGLIGVRLRVILLPLFLGTIVYQTLATFGFSNIFTLLTTAT